MKSSNLRIASLLPSTTEIVGLLGLSRHLVGVTHECDVCAPSDVDALIASGAVSRVTTSDINPHAMEQSAIDSAVKTSLEHGLSLYGLREDLLRAARPTVVLTQTLCAVCAPSTDEVQQVCKRLGAALSPDGAREEPAVHSFEPGTLDEVAQSVVDVGAACGHPERGRLARDRFVAQLAQVEAAVSVATSRPSLLLLEWLAPPFDGGHWVPDQVALAGCRGVLNAPGEKSKERSWSEVVRSDPDVVVVACCGFDLARNVADAERALADRDHPIRQLRAVREGRFFALDGNRYFARPSPSLAGGAALLARVAHGDDAAVVARLAALDFLPREGEGWARLVPRGSAALAPCPPARGSGVAGPSSTPQPCSSASHAGIPPPTAAPDIEDLWQLHRDACSRGEMFYTDPSSGLMVFTAHAALKRGKCCGAGCRHCPFDHERVSTTTRPAKIMVPAILSSSATASVAEPVGGVLFFSGGKDSFLALRALRRALPAAAKRVVLVTTFDAESRTIAHQE